MTKLKQHRLNIELSQFELALKAGIQPSLLCRIERGQKPNQSTAHRIAEAMEYPVRNLFPDFDRLRRY